MNRRELLQTLSCGFGYTALLGLTTQEAGASPLGARAPHFPAKAKRVIFLFMEGGPSQHETFDLNPELAVAASKGGRVKGGNVTASAFKFSRHGDSGLPISELFPHVARHADDLCLLHGMQTDSPAHVQAVIQAHTGSFNFVRPSMGSWVVYGLGSENLGHHVKKVGPSLPAVLSEGNEFEGQSPVNPRNRAVLALWLTRADHPLTARVMVNRVWQYHLGRGIVSSANDFGKQGQMPSHPELLDWLATEFVEQGWSLKSLHRTIMLSSTYQMASRFSDAGNLRTDPDNAYFWKANRRRLEAESLWDSIHAVSGTINLKMGGRPVMPPLNQAELSPLRFKKRWSVSADPAEHNRRAIYILSRRTFALPMFDQFDRPDSGVSCGRRDVTTVAPQSLWLMNNDVSFQQAMKLAARVVSETDGSADARVERLWRLALGRAPREDEKKSAQKLTTSLSAKGAWKQMPSDLPPVLAKMDPQEAAALTELCLTLFNLSEFSYVD